jgi:hypothetical protein
MSRCCTAILVVAACGSGSNTGISVDLMGLNGLSYSAPLTLGDQTFQVLLDTGSTTTAVGGPQCTVSGVQCTNPFYTPGSGATDTHGTATTTYADQSMWTGEVFADTASVGDSPKVRLDFASITTQTNFFNSAASQGILGLGPSDLLNTGTTSFAATLFAAGLDPIIAFEMCGDTGTMSLGGFDGSLASSAPEFTAMLPLGSGEPYYEVQLASMSLGGTTVGTSDTLGADLVDTGTSLSYLPSAAETALLAAINGSTAFQGLFGGMQLSGTSGATPCVSKTGLTSAMVDAALPPLSVTLAGSTTPIEIAASRSYLYELATSVFCLAFEDNSALGLGSDVGLLGDTLMAGTLTVFDVGNQRIGFAPDVGCKSATADADDGAGRVPVPRIDGEPWWTGAPGFRAPPTLRSSRR